jgi:hypothetical protein
MSSRDAALALIREYLDGPEFKSRPDLINLAYWAAYCDDMDLAFAFLRRAFLTEGWGQYFVPRIDVRDGVARRRPPINASASTPGILPSAGT